MKRLKKILYAWVDKKFLGGCSSYNSLKVRKSCRSKKQARQAFKKHNIPYANGKIFINPYTAYTFAKEYGFPICIKPNVSGFSRGSYFPITNFYELWKAAFKVKIWWPTSVAETYLKGKNYRVVVANGKIMSVIRRYPPFVDGDGVSTISELIDRENSIRKKMNLFPTVHPISKNSKIIGHLARQNLTLDSVPMSGDRVELFYRISLAPGGVVEIVNKEMIPDKNKELFLRILEEFDANIFGIDAIFEKGIEEDYSSQKCIFLEINSRPFLKMHQYPRYGEKEDLSSFFSELDSLEIRDSDIF